jgi:zinc transport system substrate-binding protein
MRKISVLMLFIAFAAVSCGPRSTRAEGGRVVTVTIPPFAWFVEQIGGDDFIVSVLLPPGADHHIWEPLPAQISALAGSEAFIINGQLGFEHAWMDRFRQVNPGMKVLDLSGNIQLIGSEGLKVGKSEGLKVGKSEGLKVGKSEGLKVGKPEGLKVGGAESQGEESDAGHDHEGEEAESKVGHGHEGEDAESKVGHDHEGEEAESKVGHDHEGEDAESHESADVALNEDHDHAHGGPDPHYWMSPAAARIMAKDIRDFLAELNPASAAKYDANLAAVNRQIAEVDSLVRAALGPDLHRTVMIFHPALAYMGHEYGFEQVSFEDDGKSPSPARMKELIDLARNKEIKIIFIQAEYDIRNAESLSRETGAELVVINPMNSEWPEAVLEVAKALVK